MTSERASSQNGPRGHRVVVRTAQEHYRTEITARGHALLADEPINQGGTDLGPNPYDLLLSALGSCTSITLRIYADRKGWPLESVTVHLDHQKIHAEDCAECETKVGMVDRIEQIVELRGDLDATQRKRLLEIAHRCPVHRTLDSEIAIHTVLNE